MLQCEDHGKNMRKHYGFLANQIPRYDSCTLMDGLIVLSLKKKIKKKMFKQ